MTRSHPQFLAEVVHHSPKMCMAGNVSR
jgi:hypothetical protein